MQSWFSIACGAVANCLCLVFFLQTCKVLPEVTSANIKLNLQQNSLRIWTTSHFLTVNIAMIEHSLTILCFLNFLVSPRPFHVQGDFTRLTDYQSGSPVVPFLPICILLLSSPGPFKSYLPRQIGV